MNSRHSLETARLTGATRNHPERYHGQPVSAPGELGEPPEHMSKEAQAVWHEVAEMAPYGLLKSPDRLLMEVVAGLMVEQRSAPELLPAAKLKILTDALSKLGMNPHARSGMRLPEKPPAHNPFENLAD